VTTFALVLVVVTLGLVLWLLVEINRLKRRVMAVPEDGGVFEAIRVIDADLAAVEDTVADMRPRLDHVEARLPMAIQHTAVVHYDAFDNMAGNLSRSIALLNELGDGVVISLLVGRDETRWFTKQVRRADGLEELSPEEHHAVQEAMTASA
jgi:hypothetical protein